MIGLKTLAITCILGTTRAFAPNAVAGRPALTIHAEGLTRKSVLENVAVVGAALLLNGSPALASGGATAGGAYLLSAKQRYNDRVQSCLKAYIGLQKSLAGGSVDDVAAYFSTEDVGGWKDGSAAGYLLSNAFRRNSSAPPDSLPSVKAWKAFAKSVEGVMKAAKKKDAGKTLAAIEKTIPALDSYLELVELPASAEL